MSALLRKKFDPADFKVSERIDEAETLPLLSFWDKDFLELELETVFRSSWLCLPKQHLRARKTGNGATLLDVLALRGNAVRYSILGEEVLFKRDFEPRGEPALRCFLNRCPHAFYPLLVEESDESRSKYIQCQQHGLTAECDGSLRAHPAFKAPSEAIKEKLCLTQYGLKEWNDFFFVKRGESGFDFARVFAPIFESIAGLPLAELTYRAMLEERRVVSGNWKQHAWNYMDALHINWIHKGPNGLQDAIDMSSYTTECYEGASLQWAYARNPQDGFDPKFLNERFVDKQNSDRRVFALWWLVFPNLTLNFYPWGLSVNIYLPIPGEPDKTEFFWHHYVFDKAKYRNRETQWLSSLVDFEDVDAMRKVGQALSSKTRPESRGIFGPNTEAGPHWFHRSIYRAVFE